MTKDDVDYISKFILTSSFTINDLKSTVEKLRITLNLSKRDIHELLRIMTTGQISGPDLYAMLVIFGKKDTESRFNHFKTFVI